MAGSAAVMGPPGAFATRRWLHLFCSLVAITVVSINAYFLVLFRRENLPGGAGAQWGCAAGAVLALLHSTTAGWRLCLCSRSGDHSGSVSCKPTGIPLTLPSCRCFCWMGLPDGSLLPGTSILRPRPRPLGGALCAAPAPPAVRRQLSGQRSGQRSGRGSGVGQRHQLGELRLCDVLPLCGGGLCLPAGLHAGWAARLLAPACPCLAACLPSCALLALMWLHSVVAFVCCAERAGPAAGAAGDPSVGQSSYHQPTHSKRPSASALIPTPLPRQMATNRACACISSHSICTSCCCKSSHPARTCNKSHRICHSSHSFDKPWWHFFSNPHTQDQGFAVSPNPTPVLQHSCLYTLTCSKIFRPSSHTVSCILPLCFSHCALNPSSRLVQMLYRAPASRVVNLTANSTQSEVMVQALAHNLLLLPPERL